MLSGIGLTDVTRVVLYRAGTDDVLDFTEVNPTSDSEVTFTTPELVRYLLPQDDRLDRVKVDVRLEYLDSDAPDGVVRSGPIRFDFTPPFIDSPVDGSVDPDGTSHFTLSGGFFDGVDLIVFRDPTNPDVTIATTGRVIDDQTIEVDLPAMTPYLRPQPDGTWAITIEVSVGYQANDTPRGAVLSNPAQLVFSAAAVTTVSQASQAGDREIEVASNLGWVAGAYALVSTPTGPITRRVGALGSLIFDAPVPWRSPPAR